MGHMETEIEITFPMSYNSLRSVEEYTIGFALYTRSPSVTERSLLQSLVD
jgi:hypothetical protein